MQKAINLLWTSGWDSTFRLLQIILIEKQIVQPYYILDNNRKSLNNELLAIENILKAIELKDKEAYKLILPVIYINRKDILIPSKINEAYNKIRIRLKIGSQYEWLAAFCLQEKITAVELSIFKNERTSVLFNEPNYSDSIGSHFKEAVETIYGNFSFPLIDTNKQEMYIISKNNNWISIMNLTWFCHKPKKGKPCGKCNPCNITTKEGLSFRIPFLNRLNGKIYRLLKNIK